MESAAAIVLVRGAAALCDPMGRPWPQSPAAPTLQLANGNWVCRLSVGLFGSDCGSQSAEDDNFQLYQSGKAALSLAPTAMPQFRRRQLLSCLEGLLRLAVADQRWWTPR